MLSQTNWSSLNPENLFLCRSAMCCWANLWAAIASSQSFVSCWIRSSTEGNLVCLNVVGMASGDVPIISSKDVHCQLECHQLLWVNSMVLIDLCQVSGFDEQ